jgi:hypothetical protein
MGWPFGVSQGFPPWVSKSGTKVNKEKVSLTEQDNWLRDQSAFLRRDNDRGGIAFPLLDLEIHPTGLYMKQCLDQRAFQ